jgi:DNA-binding transcriptional regulator YhcF (GntR family)
MNDPIFDALARSRFSPVARLIAPDILASPLRPGPIPVSPKRLAATHGCHCASVVKALGELVRSGALARAGHGLYLVTEDPEAWSRRRLSKRANMASNKSQHGFYQEPSSTLIRANTHSIERLACASHAPARELIPGLSGIPKSNLERNSFVVFPEVENGAPGAPSSTHSETDVTSRETFGSRSEDPNPEASPTQGKISEPEGISEPEPSPEAPGSRQSDAFDPEAQLEPLRPNASQKPSWFVRDDVELERAKSVGKDLWPGFGLPRLVEQKKDEVPSAWFRRCFKRLKLQDARPQGTGFFVRVLERWLDEGLDEDEGPELKVDDALKPLYPVKEEYFGPPDPVLPPMSPEEREAYSRVSGQHIEARKLRDAKLHQSPEDLAIMHALVTALPPAGSIPLRTEVPRPISAYQRHKKG